MLEKFIDKLCGLEERMQHKVDVNKWKNLKAI